MTRDEEKTRKHAERYGRKATMSEITGTKRTQATGRPWRVDDERPLEVYGANGQIVCFFRKQTDAVVTVRTVNTFDKVREALRDLTQTAQTDDYMAFRGALVNARTVLAEMEDE